MSWGDRREAKFQRRAHDEYKLLLQAQRPVDGASSQDVVHALVVAHCVNNGRVQGGAPVFEGHTKELLRLS
eukprot:SAG31_NODE_16344_length_712_cov_24.446982_2_plen_71_part_00